MGTLQCSCCGGVMEPVEERASFVRYRCHGCGLTDSKAKQVDG